MPMRWRFYKLLCRVGLHQWAYDWSVLDTSWPERLAVLRACSRCDTRQERPYNGYSRGGHGGWKNQRETD